VGGGGTGTSIKDAGPQVLRAGGLLGLLGLRGLRGLLDNIWLD